MTQTRYLDIDGAHERLNELGFDLTLRQVKRLADERRLPFFKPSGFNRRYIAAEDIDRFIEEQRRAAK